MEPTEIIAVKESEEVAGCDGGGGALGHPLGLTVSRVSIATTVAGVTPNPRPSVMANKPPSEYARYLLQWTGHAFRALLRGAIQFYRYVLSPWMPPRCRHLPTCSEYCLEAIDRHGARRGVWLTLKRLARCHPWGTSGYDPVP